MELDQLRALAKHFSDRPSCEAIQETFLATTTPWEVHKATANLGKGTSLPDEQGLYMFVWRPFFSFSKADETREHFPVILYVGSTGNAVSDGTIRSRFAGEYSKLLVTDGNLAHEEIPEGQMTRESKLKFGLSLKPLEFWCSVVTKAENINRLENHLLRMIRPPLNTVVPQLEAKPPRTIWSQEAK